MPELPEVEIVRRGLLPALHTRVLQDIAVYRRDLRFPISPHFEEKLTGSRINALHRRGKYIIATGNQGYAFILHLGMSGGVRIYASHQDIETKKHDHVMLTMDNGTRIIYNDPRRFGFLTLVETQNWQKQKPFSDMGPEPISNHFHTDILHEKLRGKKAPIKSALLDQRVVAGLGNIYVCEALFYSGIHPARPSHAVSLDECADLVKNIRRVLNTAIDAGGSSLKDYKHADGSLGYFQTKWAVYGRENEPCKTCGAPVQRITQSGRSTFFCETCQA